MGRSLGEKLGLKPGMTVFIGAMPEDLAPLFHAALQAGTDPTPDWQLVFVRSVADLEAATSGIVARYRRGGHLWVAYPKKTGAIATDITRDHGWEAPGALDLLPVTQVAIDTTWSTLRLRYRDEIKVLTRKG